MNYGGAYSPPCITARRGGCAVNKEVAKLPCSAQTGWFSFLFSIGKPPRPRDQRTLREIFLVARPPLLAVMQGGEYARFHIHSHLLTTPGYSLSAAARLYFTYFLERTAVIVSSRCAPRASCFTATVERVGSGSVLKYSR